MKLQNNLNQYKRFSRLIRWSMECIDRYISPNDIHMLDRIVVLDKNLNNKYPYAGGMYYLEKDEAPALIELYMEEIINGMPVFIPKISYFIKYSILRMLLHEIGHHVNREYAYERNAVEWEKESQKYAVKYLWEIFGINMYLFLTLGSISRKNITGSSLHI